MLMFMGKKQKKVKGHQTNREAETQVVKAKQKHVNKRNENGLYSNAELTPNDEQSELYKDYIKVRSIQYCKQFLHNQKNLPRWALDELAKVTRIMQERDSKKYKNNKKKIIEKKDNLL